MGKLLSGSTARLAALAALLSLACPSPRRTSVVPPPAPSAAASPSITPATTATTPPDGAPPLVGGVLTLPIDLKTLPTAVTLWTRPRWLMAAVAADGLLFGGDDGALIALDGRTGTERWRAPLADDGDDNLSTYFRGGCGVVLSFAKRGITAYERGDGAVRWRYALAPSRVMWNLTEDAQLTGCTVTISLADAPRRRGGLYEASTHLVLLDAATGRVASEHPCDDRADVEHAEPYAPNGILVSTPEQNVVVFADGTPAQRLGTQHCRAMPGDLPLCLGVRANMLERHSRVRDELVWQRPLDATATWRLAASDATHVLVRAAGLPVLVDADAATGAVRSMRWVRFRGAGDEVLVDGNLAYLVSSSDVVALDLDRGAPPLRESEAIDADIERSIAQLAVHADASSRPPEFPAGSDEAVGWLTRLARFVSQARFAQLVEAPIPEVALLTHIVGADPRPAVRAHLQRLLERSYVDVPTVELASLRHGAVRELREPLTPADARRLADATIRWVEWNGERPSSSERPAPGPRDAQGSVDGLRYVIRESRDALERLSLDPEPAELVHAAIARLGFPRPVPTCTRVDGDLALEAALRTLLELERAPGRLTLPSGACARLPPATAREPGRTRWTLTAASPLPVPRLGLPAIDDAERRTFEWMAYDAPLAATGGHIVVARISGAWRTVLVTHDWIS